MNKLLKTALALSLGGVALNAQAVLIHFEDLDAQPAGTVVNTQYQAVADGGVVFSGDLGGPFLGKVDEPLEGWRYDATLTGDMFAPGEGLQNGNNFITDVVGTDNGGTAVLRVDYTAPVKAFSFDLIDIDGTETYTINIYDVANGLIDTLTRASGDAGTGDGIVTRIGYELASNINDIGRVVITGNKDAGTKFGLGFDNFNTDANAPVDPNPTPAPAPILLMGLGALALGGMRRRKTA